MQEESGSPRVTSDAVVDESILRVAVQEQEDRGTEVIQNIADTEPLLSSFVHDELLRICGKLGLAGAAPPVLNGVARDINRLLGVTAGALRQGYRTLLMDLVLDPETGHTSPGPVIEPKNPPAAPENDQSEEMPF